MVPKYLITGKNPKGKSGLNFAFTNVKFVLADRGIFEDIDNPEAAASRAEIALGQGRRKGAHMCFLRHLLT